jgi:hypothetical protein
MTPMKVQNSPTPLPRLTAVALLTTLLQVSGVAPQLAVASQPIRGTPIDSPPESSAPAVPRDLPAKPVSALPSPPALLPHPQTAITQTNKGCLEIGFDKLSGFPTEVLYEQSVTNGVTFAHATKMTGEIPQTIHALDNQKVAVKGFMLPLKQENGLATDFILLRNRMMCCYGMMPKINEWIHVRMSGKGALCIMDTPVTISGTLHVQEYRENRTMLGIYRIDGDKLEAPAGP